MVNGHLTIWASDWPAQVIEKATCSYVVSYKPRKLRLLELYIKKCTLSHVVMTFKVMSYFSFRMLDLIEIIYDVHYIYLNETKSKRYLNFSKNN